MAIRAKDLKNQLGFNGTRPILYCRKCGNVFSAHAGDYWNVKLDYVFECCHTNMVLVTKQVGYVEAAA